MIDLIQNRQIWVADIERALRGRVHKQKPADGLVRAAVLVLVRNGREGAEVLLTRRSQAVKDHKGQVSLPGGVVEALDSDTLETALRESSEEVGLDPGRVRILGRLDDYITITGYHVTPWVAAIDSFDGLAPRTAEIDRVFSFPLSVLLDPQKVTKLKVQHPDGDVIVCEYDGETIWGATARILMGLLEALP